RVVNRAGERAHEFGGLLSIVAADVRRLTSSSRGLRSSEIFIQSLLTSAATTGEILVQVATCDQAHAEVMLALHFADLEDRNDVGVIQRGSSFGFGFEPLDDLLT